MEARAAVDLSGLDAAAPNRRRPDRPRREDSCEDPRGISRQERRWCRRQCPGRNAAVTNVRPADRGFCRCPCRYVLVVFAAVWYKVKQRTRMRQTRDCPQQTQPSVTHDIHTTHAPALPTTRRSRTQPGWRTARVRTVAYRPGRGGGGTRSCGAETAALFYAGGGGGVDSGVAEHDGVRPAAAGRCSQVRV